jgi:universal stress protein E
MRQIRRILVAVKHPGATPLPGVAKAAQLAQALSAELTLFRAIPAPICVGEKVHELKYGMADLDDCTRSAHQDALEAIARRLRRRGLDVSASVQWDHPADEAILREAARTHADLIIAESHPRGHHGATLLHFTDWQLLRRSPVPVLLVKGSLPYRRPRVLVALDPDHTFGKPVRLDGQILAAGSALANALQGELHAVHAYAPLSPHDIPQQAPSPTALAEVQREAAALAVSKLAHAVRTADIPAANRHVVGRHVPDAIEQVATDTHSAIVVMGEVARSGLKHLLIGNTAERVLDRLACDVLLVKPQRAKRRVARVAATEHRAPLPTG